MVKTITRIEIWKKFSHRLNKLLSIKIVNSKLFQFLKLIILPWIFIFNRKEIFLGFPVTISPIDIHSLTWPRHLYLFPSNDRGIVRIPVSIDRSRFDASKRANIAIVVHNHAPWFGYVALLACFASWVKKFERYNAIVAGSQSQTLRHESIYVCCVCSCIYRMSNLTSQGDSNVLTDWVRMTRVRMRHGGFLFCGVLLPRTARIFYLGRDKIIRD